MADHSPCLYPAYLDLRNIQVLVVGGGAVAARKVAGLRKAGARITVVSPAFNQKLFQNMFSPPYPTLF